LRTNEVIYDLITLGTAMEQTIKGDSKSFNLQIRLEVLRFFGYKTKIKIAFLNIICINID
jgi:hypothetical protein